MESRARQGAEETTQDSEWENETDEGGAGKAETTKEKGPGGGIKVDLDGERTARVLNVTVLGVRGARYLGGAARAYNAQGGKETLDEIRSGVYGPQEEESARYRYEARSRTLVG